MRTQSVVLVQENPQFTNIRSNSTTAIKGSYDGVVITPNFIEFKDATEGVTCRQRVVIRNSGFRPAFVRIRDPKSIAFQVKNLKRGVMLNPGLSVSTTVLYTFKRPSLLSATIPIEINGKVVHYHVLCTLSSERISIEPKAIDFGTIDVGYSSGVKIISIANDGGKSTRFSIDLGQNDLEITVKPLRGIVRPHRQVNLKVELIGLREGTYYSEFWIKSTPNIRVPLTVNVIVPRLVAYHPNTTGDFTLMDFPPTFENTQRYDTFILRNLSSQMASYVVLGEVGNEIQCIRDIDRKAHPVFSTFEIKPVEGRMDPFEGIIFEVKFSPTKELMLWRQKLNKQESLERREGTDSRENDFMAFMRIVRVHCTETKDILKRETKKDIIEDTMPDNKTIIFDTAIMDITPYSSSRISSVVANRQDTVRLCLHGEVEPVHLNLQPDVLYFGDICIGETSQRVLRISNASSFTPVSFECIRNACVYCEPEYYRLKADGSMEVLVKVKAKENAKELMLQPNIKDGLMEVLVKVTAKENVTSPFKLFIDAIVDSNVSSPRRRQVHVNARRYPVQCYVNILPHATEGPKPEFVLGLTPLITHQVGLNTNQATFKSDVEKPRQAILMAHKDRRRPWANKHLISCNAVPDSLPAYPNDTQCSLRRHTGPPVRSIFTGKLRRTSGPIQPEALSREEEKCLKEHRDYWLNYIRREMNASKKKLVFKNKYEDDSDVVNRVSRLPKWKFKSLFDTFDCSLGPPGSGKSKTSHFGSKAEVLIPLSPIQIYNVHIFPMMFTFGMVAPDSNNYRQLIVENSNEFPVMIRLLNTSSKQISFPEGNLIILPGGSTVARLVELHARDLGKFNGYIDYIINDNHTFELSITADVVAKQLSLNTREVQLGSEWLPDELYQPLATTIQIKNKLDANTAYRWKIPPISGFLIEPPRGTLRGNSALYVYVYHEPTISKSTSTDAIMKCEGGTYITVRMNMPLQKPNVAFIYDIVDFGNVPINVTTRRTAIIRNFDPAEFMFEVDQSGLAYGCEINPMKGVIPPCGVARVEIILTLDACVRFSTTIRLIVQRSFQLPLKISGTVPCPRLKLSPDSINLRRISAAAYICQEITARNIGTTVLKLNFVFEDYTEFWVSLLPTRKDKAIGSEGIIIPPGTTTKFYLHFEPVDLASYAFYLPIVINEIFGPALTDCPKSLLYSEYTKSHEVHYANFPGFHVEQLTAKLSSTFVDCTVAKHIVHFNKLVFSFNDATKEQDFKIENKDTPRTVQLSIAINELSTEESPFSIKWKAGAEAKIESNSIACSLELNSYIEFALNFEPKSEGDFVAEAPIFLLDQFDGQMFNKLCLFAENPAASLECEPEELYVAPLPLGVMVEETFKLRAKNFRQSAVISARIIKYDRVCGEYRNCMLVIDFPHGNAVEPGPQKELNCKVVFKSTVPMSVCLNVEFRTDCKTIKCPMKIYLASDNNLLTTHIQTKKSLETFRKIWVSGSFVSKTSTHTMEATEEEELDETVKLASKRYTQQSTRESLGRISLQTSVMQRRDSKAIESKYKIDGDKCTLDTEITDHDADTIDPSSELHRERKDSLHSDESSTKLRKVSSKQFNYPFYPVEGRNDEYEMHMRTTVLAAEQWLYSGPYKFKFYPKILDGVTTFLCNQFENKKALSTAVKQKNQSFNWSFINVISSLAGNEFDTFIGYTKNKIPEDPVEKIQYILGVCERMLQFLLQQGACLSHVAAELLLGYDDYLLVSATNQTESTDIQLASISRMSRQMFECRSKQCWLDVILQTYKCYVLKAVSEIKFERKSAAVTVKRRSLLRESISVSSIPRDSEVYERSMRNVMALMKDRRRVLPNYSNEESILLAWLQLNYDQQCEQEWMRDKRLILNPKEATEAARRRLIQNFDIDLIDSLVLITATAAYCPFLIEDYFQNLYISPRNYEETVHNAICVIDAWRRIRLGFMISPMEIVSPNAVQMLMLVEHLFRTLPTYIPRAKIKFCCPLTETVIRQISFTNPTSYGISYAVLFIGNDPGFFTIVNPQSTLRLNGHDSAQLRIKYHARKIRKIRAYLLLCGSALGPNFGRNHTFILKGRVDSLRITNEYGIRTRLYQVVEKTLKISIPYEYETEYEIWVTTEEPTKPNTLRMAKWSELIARKIPRRLFLNDKSISVAENAREAELHITVACIAPSRRSFWLIFQSKLGDFIIQINSEWQPSVTDRLVIEWSAKDKECICANLADGEIDSDCPRNIVIPIPSRNTQLWNCVSRMFEKTLDSQERLFWARYLDTYIGLRLIRWLMGDTTDTAAMEFAHIFQTKVTYNVTASDKSCEIVLPDTVTIEDVRPLNKTVSLNAHLPEIPSGLHEMTLSLNSTSNREKRLYVISVMDA